MNSHNISVETEKINSQLQRADLKKNILIRSINREYEFYLNLLRDLLYISVEKGVTELFNDSSINDDFLNANGLLTLLEKKISNLIYRKLPLITVEQLKINSIEEYINEEINFNGLGISLTKKDDKKEKSQNQDTFELEKPIQFQITKDFSDTSQYYKAENHEKFVSLDLDKNDRDKYLFNKNIIENIGVDNQFIFSLLEIIEEVNVEKPRYLAKDNIKQMHIPSGHQNLRNFDLIDRSLENLLLNLSYKINEELFKANLINKMISKDSFEYLVRKKLMIKHPYPFVINFDFNLNQSLSKGDNFPSIIFFNISTVELEYKNLNLSIQRNKINELKNQFQRLVKKETYWRQKGITLNKIR